eukprot:TRINITY_DN62099_c0_g1_i1.p1 TRINITY_DN62099_c0_g1~~TRINITY_DN62099_c0_g1_i1.p1  ORF type:complete len:442 (-),score=30.16 TRINITY_DN62099_c0_g1_i1:1371-2696(-)
MAMDIDVNLGTNEFGGPIGVAIIMIWSHFHVYYLWACNTYNGGAMLHPDSLSDIIPFFNRMFEYIKEGAAPTLYTTAWYLGFLVFTCILNLIMPGPTIKGLPIAHQGGRQLKYLCNGVWSWWATLATAAALHVSGIFPLTEIVDNLGSFMTVSIITGDVVSVLIYVGGIVTGNAHRMSGNVIYDFFMGSWLNPRIGIIDLKMWSEIRISWALLFLITTSCAIKQGTPTAPMVFILVAHFLYANACQKGEECIPTSFDMLHEKWGWMLIWWNFAGVPFAYTFQSVYIYNKGTEFSHSTFFMAFFYFFLFLCYYIFDTANSQKNRFRMIERGTYIPRKAFPQLPWGTLKNPTYIRTSTGSKLLTSGWYGIARKIHYTADIGMAFSWGAMCGFTNFLPFFYVSFFATFLYHRTKRDFERCAKKYGTDWDKYCNKVPYTWIPYVH